MKTEVLPCWSCRGRSSKRLIHRLVLDYYTAKRLLEALHWSVQQHESVYGVLEIDVQKRLR